MIYREKKGYTFNIFQSFDFHNQENKKAIYHKEEELTSYNTHIFVPQRNTKLET